MSKWSRGEFLGVSATLAAALGLGHLPAQADERGPRAQGRRTAAGDEPDLVLLNGRVYTVDEELVTIPEGGLPRAEAFAVKHGRFVAVGSSHDIENLVGPGTEVIDARGMTVLPGFIDAHSHPASGGIRELTLVRLDLPSNAEVLEALRERAAETPPGHLVRGFMYEETKVREGRPVTIKELDEAVPDHPVRINTRSAHVGWYNSMAFELAGVTRDTEDPPDGRFERDADGNLTGQVQGGAQDLFGDIAPEYPEVTRALRQEGVRHISERKTAAGLTSVHDAGAGDLVAYQDAYEAGELGIRIATHVRGAYESLKAAGIRTGFGDEWLRLNGVKYSSDGAASNRTMRLGEPYVGRPDDYGLLYMTQEEIYEAVEDAYAHDWQIGIHANGDVAIDMVLNAYERVLDRFPRKDNRPRIEHCSLVNPDLLHRIREVGAVPTPFYTYVYWHGTMFHEYGADRMEWMFAHRSFLDHGIPVAPASDYVPGPFEPLMAIQSMVTRTDFQGTTWGPSQRITVPEAIKVCTLHGAYASYEEKLKGTIAPGKLADFVVLGDDPHEVPPDEIMEIPIVRTVVGGQAMHEL